MPMYTIARPPVAADRPDPGANDVGRSREALLGLRQERRPFAVPERDDVAFCERQGFPDLSRRHAVQPVEVDDADLELLAVHVPKPASDESGCRNGGPSVHESNPLVQSRSRGSSLGWTFTARSMRSSAAIAHR